MNNGQNTRSVMGLLIRSTVHIMIIIGLFVASDITGYPFWILGTLWGLMIMDTQRRQNKANDPELDAHIENNNRWAEAFGVVAIGVVIIISASSG